MYYVVDDMCFVRVINSLLLYRMYLRMWFCYSVNLIPVLLTLRAGLCHKSTPYSLTEELFANIQSGSCEFDLSA